MFTWKFKITYVAPIISQLNSELGGLTLAGLGVWSFLDLMFF